MISIVHKRNEEEPWCWPSEGNVPGDLCIIEEELPQEPPEEIMKMWEEIDYNNMDNYVLMDNDVLVYKLNPWIPAVLYYVSPQDTRVKSFLEDHPFLHCLLNEARWQIFKHFGDVTASIEVFRYQEVPCEEELVVYINVPFTVPEAMERLDALLEEWWIDNLDQAKGKMGFDLHFQ